jgi:HK97 gp10 family phage protein
MASGVKFEWRGNRALQQVNTAATRGMRKAGTVIIKEMRRLMTEEPKSGRLYGTHRASAPGEPAASDTGRLVKSFLSKITKENDRIVLTINSDQPHFKWVEQGTTKMEKRPVVPPAVKNMTPQIIRLIAQEIHNVIGGPQIIG